MKSGVHVGTKSVDQDQCAPFCAVRAWRPLGKMKIAEEPVGDPPDGPYRCRWDHEREDITPISLRSGPRSR